MWVPFFFSHEDIVVKTQEPRIRSWSQQANKGLSLAGLERHAGCCADHVHPGFIDHPSINKGYQLISIAIISYNIIIVWVVTPQWSGLTRGWHCWRYGSSHPSVHLSDPQGFQSRKRREQRGFKPSWILAELHYALAESWLSCHKTRQNPLALAPALDDPDSECHSKIWHWCDENMCLDWFNDLTWTRMNTIRYWSRWSRWSPRKRSLLVVMAIAAFAYAAASTAGSAGIFSQARRTFCCRKDLCFQ